MKRIERMLLAFIDLSAVLWLIGSVVGYWWLQLAFGRAGVGLDVMLQAGLAIMALICIVIAGTFASMLWIASRIMGL